MPHPFLISTTAAGYFLWAAATSVLYRGSQISILLHTLSFLVSLFSLHPFCHHVSNLFLLTQCSTLVLDIYGCGVLLFGKRSKTNVVLKFIHPAVFFLARICVALPVSYNFMKDLFLLIASGNAHSEGEDRVCCLLYPTVALSP